MASGKEIRTKISSIKNTQKITRAMQMVASSRMRKTQDRMARTRPYSTKVRQVISHLAQANPEYKHPYTKVYPDIKRVGFIVVSTDRSLCGGLNVNLFKQTVIAMKEWKDKGVEIDLCLIGSKGLGFFKRLGANIVAHTEQLGEEPELNSLIGVIKTMLDAYDNEELHGLYIANNVFVNTMSQQPTVNQLLPLEESKEEKLPYVWDYIYEPDAQELLDTLLKRYVESQVYQAVVENIACEQAARMVAMKSATDNAGTLIDELQLAYNKARQAAITQELSEIVAGAEAV